MVKKSHTKRKRDIKTKLMAAICMLLVSSIMMVSTTYAWFTLSTAPEVTGINTSVGANGNLEMALLPADGDLNKITTGSSDSTKAVTDRNITWGNLVDVSDASYGLNKITLYPSALNIGADGKLPTNGTFLQTPLYGADGRVSQLQANTYTGIYNTANSSFSPDSFYGVRAVGTASGMTDRQLSYRNARTAANTAMSLATKAAADSLTNNGGALADIAIKKGTGATSYTQANVDSLYAIVEDLQEANGILAQIEKAYMQYILAYAASAANTAGDAVWSAVKNLVEAENATLKTVLDGLTTAGLVSLPSYLTDAIAAYNDYNPSDVDSTVDKVADAYAKLEALTPAADGSYTWEQLSPVLTTLANPDEMQVNDIPAGQIMQEGNMQKLVNSVMGGKGLVVSMATGGGVYADIADQCGDFTAGVKIQKVEYGGLELGPLDAKMNTKTSVKPAYLVAVGTAVELAGAPASGAAGAVPITDMFGYVIDMAFRTNAADSNLLLQADAVDRIYQGSTGVEMDSGRKDAENKPIMESTMGGGAYMEFTSTTNSFGNEKVAELMKAVKIVFFDPNSGEIYAYAKLDVANADTTVAGGLKAQMVLYTVTTADAYVEATVGATHKAETTYVAAAEGQTATHIADDSAAGGYRPVTGEEVATHVAVTSYVAATEGATHKLVKSGAEVVKTDNVLMALNQNQPTKLSVLVYLDGNLVGNEDVAANVATSVNGTMNLQFSSSATLVPMNYTQLMPQGTGTPETPAG